MSTNNPTHMLTLLWRYRDLIVQMIQREIQNKYRGSFAGILWLVLTPLCMLTLYSIVFGIFMNIQFPGITNRLMYSLVIYIGLIILNFFSECIVRSSIILQSNPSFVKKIVFPVEIYPWVIIGAASFHLLINVGILLIFCILIMGKIQVTLAFLPFLFIPLILITLGFSWFLCSIGAYIKDTAHILPFMIQIIMYLSPVFYSIQTVPHLFQTILLCNPLTFLIEQARGLVIFGSAPNWEGLALHCCVSFMVAWLGYIWFQNTKEGFAEVL